MAEAKPEPLIMSIARFTASFAALNGLQSRQSGYLPSPMTDTSDREMPTG